MIVILLFMPVYLSIANVTRACAYLVPYILMHQPKALAHSEESREKTYIDMLEQLEQIKNAWITQDETEFVIEFTYRETEYHAYHCKYYDLWKTNPLCKKILINNELKRKFVIIDLNNVSFSVIENFKFGRFREVFSFKNLMESKALRKYIRTYTSYSHNEKNPEEQYKITQFILQNHRKLFLHANNGDSSAFDVVQDSLFRRAKVLRSLYFTTEQTQEAHKLMEHNDSDSIPELEKEMVTKELEKIIKKMFLLKEPSPH